MSHQQAGQYDRTLVISCNTVQNGANWCDFAGGFACQCWLGYSGDGIAGCTPTLAVTDLASQYVTEATQGPLICDVAYPPNAPGSAYDPTLIPGQTNNTAVVSNKCFADCSFQYVQKLLQRVKLLERFPKYNVMFML